MATTSTTTDFSTSIINDLNAQGKKKTTTATEDQKATFLNLLTTQLKNQDPLNPMDNAQMTSQLAQISTVDGIERLNQTLTAMMSSSSTDQTLQAAALVGHGALVKGSALELSASGAIGGYDLASKADIVKIQVTDANGNVVRDISLSNQDAGVQNFVWDGKDNSGTALATGSYKFTVTATQGTNDVTADALQFGTISGVVRNSTGVLGIDVGTFGRFSVDDLKQII